MAMIKCVFLISRPHKKLFRTKLCHYTEYNLSPSITKSPIFAFPYPLFSILTSFCSTRYELSRQQHITHNRHKYNTDKVRDKSFLYHRADRHTTRAVNNQVGHRAYRHRKRRVYANSRRHHKKYRVNTRRFPRRPKQRHQQRRHRRMVHHISRETCPLWLLYL